MYKKIWHKIWQKNCKNKKTATNTVCEKNNRLKFGFIIFMAFNKVKMVLSNYVQKY